MRGKVGKMRPLSDFLSHRQKEDLPGVLNAVIND